MTYTGMPNNPLWEVQDDGSVLNLRTGEIDSAVKIQLSFLLGGNAELFEVPEEFNHLLKVMEFGVNKHGANNWLNDAGSKSSFKAMHKSMQNHLTESLSGVREDHETDLDPLLHLACRALMLYTRIQRRIIH